MKKILLSLALLGVSVHAQSWYDKLSLEVEAGMYLNDFKGDISNTTSSADYRDDLGFENTDATYLGLELRNEYSYVPNMKLNYMNTKQEKDSNIAQEDAIEVATQMHSGPLSSSIDYEVLDLVFYHTFAYRGKMLDLLLLDIYSGDIEFNLGLHVKNIGHSFKIISQEVNEDKTRDVISYVDVGSNIVMPYFGFKYYWYNLRAFATVSALSLSEAKALDYETGLEYQIIDGLSVGASYMYKEFEATEVKDTVDFSTYGAKMSVKYRF